MKLGRRDLLKTSGGAVALILLQSTGFDTSTDADPPGLDVAILVDASRCSGCWKCHAACSNQNNLKGTAQFDPADLPQLLSDCWTTLVAVKRGKAWR